MLKRIGLLRSIMYLIAQLIGSTLASVYLWFVLPFPDDQKLKAVTKLYFNFSPINGILLEMILTFFLVFTVFIISKEENEEQDEEQEDEIAHSNSSDNVLHKHIKSIPVTALDPPTLHKHNNHNNNNNHNVHYHHHQVK